MSTPNDGGPAFPKLERLENPDQKNDTQCVSSGGMTLRDYFAAKYGAAIVTALIQRLGSEAMAESPARRAWVVAFAGALADAAVEERAARATKDGGGNTARKED